MQLHSVDIAIIVAYIVLVMMAGFAVSKLASRNLNSYFLGGNKIPWYVLGVADASGMFDVTGTMWLVMTIFVYGLKGAWLPWVWPTFNQVFLMVYLSAWLRRSNAMTGAEWITTRFGTSTGAKLSHVSVVIFAIVSVIVLVAYQFRGMGKFAQIFLPWDLSANQYATILMSVTAVYVILGGMVSVTITDVIQYLFTTMSAVLIGIVAIKRTTAADIAAAVPTGWDNLFFGWKLNLDWSQRIPALADRIAEDGWELFTIFFTIMMFKGVLVSAAGPSPNYSMQRVLSTRNPKEAAKMNWFAQVVLFFPRYLMITGITILGLVYFKDQIILMGRNFDVEQVLPNVIARFLPVGLLGIVLAGLLAAFMSTFNSTVNGGASYVANDLYKRYINPTASDKTYVRMSYLCSILVVVVGIAFGFMTESINSITQWFVAGLWGGYTAPNVLKWYWWRFNSLGYFAGMIAGIASALVLPLLVPAKVIFGLERNMALFPIILVVSAASCVLISLLTKPDDLEILKKFYKQVRPWGFWGPIRDIVCREDPSFRPNKAFGRDMVNVAVGTVWQLTLVLVPIYIIIRHFKPMWISIAVLAVTSVFLKMNWYDKLERD